MNEKMEVEVKIKNIDEFNRLLVNLKNAFEALNGFEFILESKRWEFDHTIKLSSEELSEIIKSYLL